MKIIRWFLGNLILFFDALFTPKGIQRSDADQKKVELSAQNLKLYEFNACPFCVKVRRELKRLSVSSIERKDVLNDPVAHQELMEGGKVLQVPCLRIVGDDGQVQWMYESSDIVTFLRGRFANP